MKKDVNHLRRSLGPAFRLAGLGLVPALGFALLRATRLSDALPALTSVQVGAEGGPSTAGVFWAVLTELCWLGWKALTPACIVAALLLGAAALHGRPRKSV